MRTYNTGETEEDLRREYNPDGSTLRRAQLRMLDMAVYLQRTAQEAGVPCRLDGGNVLGALRHGGFIPWDDDIDMVVHYRDFHRLCQYLKEHPHPRYVLQDHSTDSGYYKEWATLRDLGSEHLVRDTMPAKERRAHEALKYRGLHVDIFPYEGKVIPWMQRLAAKLSCVVNFKLAGRCPVLAEAGYRILHHAVIPVMRFLGHCFGSEAWYMHSYGAWFYERNPKQMMVPHRDLVFEGITFEGPADGDGLCRIAYGDYMQLPPREKRDRHNVDIVFLDDASATETEPSNV